MKQVSKEQWYRMLDLNCRRDKHRLRMNKFGVTWCVICGMLSNKPADPATEDETLLIVCKDED